FLDWDDFSRGDGKVEKISSAALRTLHEFLKRKDPEKIWGGLTRTTTPEGDVLWLCKDHIKELYPTSG
ncbi:MAG: hypothetical protein AAF327_16845, partial [Cyanobacteria bacterium P01_A01_bin.37]